MNNLKKAGMFSLLFIAIAMLSITSCKKDDDVNPVDNGDGPLYGFLAAVEDPDGRVNYLHTTSEIGPDVKFEASTA